jgi:hypothetical protein
MDRYKVSWGIPRGVSARFLSGGKVLLDIVVRACTLLGIVEGAGSLLSVLDGGGTLAGVK